ncbi:hypothetical protein DV515_00006374 [Chloebia gouldiae]|uniref:Uncharacterized protein n=1 Tax=Chloebia gouldiae TaxID=44316 RepID=A0A3L8SLA4_CHLGU|nr:hypothetical protein DV515_00006374 [Chloebia gouldiae]
MPPRQEENTNTDPEALQAEPQSPFTEILVRAPEMSEIRPPTPLGARLGETPGRAECHRWAQSRSTVPTLGGAGCFTLCLP